MVGRDRGAVVVVMDVLSFWDFSASSEIEIIERIVVRATDALKS